MIFRFPSNVDPQIEDIISRNSNTRFCIWAEHNYYWGSMKCRLRALFCRIFLHEIVSLNSPVVCGTDWYWLETRDHQHPTTNNNKHISSLTLNIGCYRTIDKVLTKLKLQLWSVWVLSVYFYSPLCST